VLGESQMPTDSRTHPFVGVLAGGLIAGLLDIVYAFVLSGLNGGNPMGVLRSVASGLLGAAAFKGGMTTAALGLVLHLAITVVAAGVYFLLARRAAVVQEHYWIFGSIFGVLVFLTMNFVVLPLSAVPFKLTYPPLVLLQGFVSHAVLVGIPIALCLRYFGFARGRSSSAAA
jgi:hypothetical protein